MERKRNMVDIVCDQNLYKIPSEDILQNRRAFYSLRRGNGESTGQWLKRIQNCIDSCEFTIFIDILLIDRFVCGLNANELKTVHNSNTWTLKQLLDFFTDENVNTGRIETNLMIDDQVNRIENISLDMIKTEAVSTFFANLYFHL